MKTIPVSRIMLIFVLALACAQAQPPEKPDREHPPHAPTRWEKLDTDRDRFLSLEEFRTMPRVARLPPEKQFRLFQRLDKNNDGKLRITELHRNRHGRNRGRAIGNMRRIMELDRDGSQGVSLEEFRAAEMFAKIPPHRVDAIFKRLDTNGDGEITPADRPNHRRGNRIRREHER